MFSNGAWLFLFGRDNKWGFAVSLIDIFVMLGSGLCILMEADRSEVNIFEGIFVRGTFSLYSGWVTTATALNIAFLIKSWNNPNFDARKKDDDEYKSHNDKIESDKTCQVLWVIFCLYNVFTFYELNPFFGLVLIWVLIGLKARHHLRHENIYILSNRLLRIQGVLLVVMTLLSFCGKYLGISHGLFYN